MCAPCGSPGCCWLLGLVVPSLGATAHPASASEVKTSIGCRLPDGPLTRHELPAGLSVTDCGGVGRVVRVGHVGIAIPPPGNAAGLERLRADGGTDDFQVQVARDGTVSYLRSQQGTAPIAVPASSPGACSDAAYNTLDLKEYGTCNWWIGDGGMPAALSRSAAQKAFADAINSITGSDNNCCYSDQVSARSHYLGSTFYEGDMNARGDCTPRDKKSTWDAGDLPTGTLAQTCFWSSSSPGAKNDLLEADVRYNTHDYNFTDSPTSSSCHNQYDIRSVGTHEAGHVFGMGHVGGHSNLTMYTTTFACKATGRTLGKGDVLGLRSIY